MTVSPVPSASPTPHIARRSSWNVARRSGAFAGLERELASALRRKKVQGKRAGVFGARGDISVGMNLLRKGAVSVLFREEDKDYFSALRNAKLLDMELEKTAIASCGSISKLDDLPAGSLDIVVSDDAVSTLSESLIASHLRGIFRILPAGGLLAVTVPEHHENVFTNGMHEYSAAVKELKLIARDFGGNRDNFLHVLSLYPHAFFATFFWQENRLKLLLPGEKFPPKAGDPIISKVPGLAVAEYFSTTELILENARAAGFSSPPKIYRRALKSLRKGLGPEFLDFNTHAVLEFTK